MSNFFQSVRQGFGRGSSKNNNNNNNNNNSGTKENSNNGGNSQLRTSPSMPLVSSSSSQNPLAPSLGSVPASEQPPPPVPAPESERIRYFFQARYATLNVKGNFLTLCACPKNVELGEWLAHQVVEQYRLLHAMLQVVQEVNSLTGQPICNANSCPSMSAGRTTYAWLVDGKTAKISAPKFINRVEKWIVGKIHDPATFPTTPFNVNSASAPAPVTSANAATMAVSGSDWIGKSSGLPRTFYKDCQGMMKQMFRCYAHLYHNHWENPFYHINKHEILNLCFVHFVTVAKYYGLVPDQDMEPMQPLIDIFIKQEKIPPEALEGHWHQQANPSFSSHAVSAPMAG